MRLPVRARPLVAIAVLLCALAAGGAVRRVQDTCGPFTDVSALFCPYVLEAYYTGITAGTSATTFSPDVPITRGQAAVFVTKGLNQALARGSRRSALGQWWTTQSEPALARTNVGSLPFQVVADGADVWVTIVGDGQVARVRASDGKLLDHWTGATNALAILSAMGKVFLTTNYPPQVLYMIDPAQPSGDVVPVSDSIGDTAYGLAFDGSRIWATGFKGAVNIIHPGPTVPWAVTKVTEGFTELIGIAFDGTNMWVGDQIAEKLHKLDANGAILQTVSLAGQPAYFTFDGSNLWVPINSDGVHGVAIVQVSTGTVLTTLTGNGLTQPYTAAFDGQRVLVTSGDRLSLWKAADLSPIADIPIGAFDSAGGVCSDGINFWIAMNGVSQLARF